jgi:hypothetical protein
VAPFPNHRAEITAHLKTAKWTQNEVQPQHNVFEIKIQAKRTQSLVVFGKIPQKDVRE